MKIKIDDKMENKTIEATVNINSENKAYTFNVEQFVHSHMEFLQTADKNTYFTIEIN